MCVCVYGCVRRGCVCVREGQEKMWVLSDPCNPMMSLKEESAGTISQALLISFMVQFEVHSMLKLMNHVE